jgi:bifunctional non-homologous end joining protein LigD
VRHPADGTTSFSLIQNASDAGNSETLVFFLFDLLHLDGEALSARPLQERKERLRALLADRGSTLHLSDHQIGRGRPFYDHACALKGRNRLETGRRALCPRQSWSMAESEMPEPRGVRGGRLDRSGRDAALSRGLAPCRLIYAGRAGTGIGHAELRRLWRRLQPLATPKMPLDLPPPRDSRFGSPLVLARVHWVRPELVAEVKYLTWTEDNLLRQVVYEGLREDKPPTDVRRPIPHP